MNSLSIVLALKCKKLQNVAALSKRLIIIHKVESVPKCYPTNYVLLAFITCGLYFKDYDHLMGTLTKAVYPSN